MYLGIRCLITGFCDYCVINRFDVPIFWLIKAKNWISSKFAIPIISLVQAVNRYFVHIF